jgi:hypothetical protein
VVDAARRLVGRQTCQAVRDAPGHVSGQPFAGPRAALLGRAKENLSGKKSKKLIDAKHPHVIVTVTNECFLLVELS